MSNLIEILLKQDREIAQRLTSKIGSRKRKNNIDPNQLAIEIYNTALKEMQKNYKKKSLYEHFPIEKNIQKCLEEQVTKLLSPINLLTENNYQTIQRVVDNWDLGKVNDQKIKYQKIKKLILELLPAVRQKQQLLQVCDEYKNHLKNTIEEQIASDFPGEYQLYKRPHIQMVLVRGLGYQSKAVEAKDMNFFVNYYSRGLEIKDESLKLAMEKYQVVTGLQNTLQSPKSVTVQITEFRQKLKISQPVIEKSRDTSSQIFLKAIATLLSLGAAILAGIWSVKGHQAIDHVKKILATKEVQTGRANV